MTKYDDFEDFEEQSRIDRFEKRRKNTKLISTFMVIAGILIVILIGSFLFNGDEEATSGKLDTTNKQTEHTEGGQSQTKKDKQDSSTTKSQTGKQDNHQQQNSDEERVVTNSDDPNVIEVITSDWPAIETTQEEPHVATYDEKSIDWKEMQEAIVEATNIKADDMIIWWVTNGGSPQKVLATITNKAQTEIYRVYVEWQTNQGWKPTKLEKLKENDQKYRFEDN